jgi:hypothetical protein
MNHLDESQLVEAYYGDLGGESRSHIEQCAECRSRLEQLGDVLDLLRDYPVPHRGSGYGGEVWTRLLPHLPQRRTQRFWLRWWTIAPALATLLAVAFLAGVLTQRSRESGIPAKARERILLVAISDHLERSEIVLTELLNANPKGLDAADERDRARDLLVQNRLLRQSALRDGDVSHALLLDDLERVLLDLANSPSRISSGDVERLRQQIESDGLLFRIRITSTDARYKGQKL